MLGKYDVPFCILTKDLGFVSPLRLCRRVQRPTFSLTETIGKLRLRLKESPKTHSCWEGCLLHVSSGEGHRRTEAAGSVSVQLL